MNVYNASCAHATMWPFIAQYAYGTLYSCGGVAQDNNTSNNED
jgi:hypothetical protein